MKKFFILIIVIFLAQYGFSQDIISLSKISEEKYVQAIADSVRKYTTDVEIVTNSTDREIALNAYDNFMNHFSASLSEFFVIDTKDDFKIISVVKLPESHILAVFFKDNEKDYAGIVTDGIHISRFAPPICITTNQLYLSLSDGSYHGGTSIDIFQYNDDKIEIKLSVESDYFENIEEIFYDGSRVFYIKCKDGQDTVYLALDVNTDRTLY